LLPVFSLVVSEMDDSSIERVDRLLRKSALLCKKEAVTAPVQDKQRRRAVHDVQVTLKKMDEAHVEMKRLVAQHGMEKIKEMLSLVVPENEGLTQRNFVQAVKVLSESKDDLLASSAPVNSKSDEHPRLEECQNDQEQRDVADESSADQTSASAGNEVSDNRSPSAESQTGADPSSSHDTQGTALTDSPSNDAGTGQLNQDFAEMAPPSAAAEPELTAAQ
jgi:hypothetical protein